MTIGAVATPSALTLAGGSILDFNMGLPGTTDMVQVNGNLTLNSGADTLNLNCLTGFTYGTYELVGCTGSLIDNSPAWTITHTASVPADAEFGVTMPGNGETILTVSNSTVGTLTWTGQNGGNWNTTDADWSGSSTKYSNNGALVTFPSGVTNSNITINAGSVSPVSVTFTNTALARAGHRVQRNLHEQRDHV